MHIRTFFVVTLLVLFILNAGVHAADATDGPPRNVFDVAQSGAVGDGKTMNADAFRAAIDACKKAGGGIVRVPAGKFLTGPIDFVDGMTLQVDEGATLLIS